MAFWGKSFIYDGIPSENFGLFVSNTTATGGLIDSPQGSDISLITKKLLRDPVNYLFGVEQSPVLEFDLEFTADGNYITAEDRNIIASWLFGRQNYNKLQILQCDMDNVYYNCIITKSTTTFIGNQAVGWKAHIVCDSPFAWENSKTSTYTYSGSAIVNTQITINNTSADNYYTYPNVVFTTSGIGDSFSITNVTDNNRLFAFTGISAYETMTVDCRRQILSSSTGLKRLSKFNLKWLRFIKGINTLSLSGGITSLNIGFPISVKIGG